MLDMAWSSSITKDPLILADAIELSVAFDDACNGRFTRANFQHYVAMENLGDDNQTYITGDEADEYNEQFEQALDLIMKRADWLGEAYPFSAASGEALFMHQATARSHLPYLFLLLCSNGNSVPSLKTSLPVQFENLCKEAFRSLFPDWADVLLFSKDSEDRRYFLGSAASAAVPKLAEKLNTAPQNTDQLSNTQREFGIDLIAICPFGDQSPYPFFAFAQCTIEQEWWGKKHEAIAENELAGFITLNVRHSNFLMIPHFPRYSLESWSEDPARTGNCILCDRFRICKLLEKSSFFRQDNPPTSISDVFQKIENNLVKIHS